MLGRSPKRFRASMVAVAQRRGFRSSTNDKTSNNFERFGPNSGRRQQGTPIQSGNRANQVVRQHQANQSLIRTPGYEKIPEFLHRNSSAGSSGNTAYKQNYVNFITKHGFSDAQDIVEQLELLSESEKLQYDPDDPMGMRLPYGHPGRSEDDIRDYLTQDQRMRKSGMIDGSTKPRFSSWTEREKYTGRNFKREKREYDHFNKSFYLDSCPPFPDQSEHQPPTKLNSELIRRMIRNRRRSESNRYGGSNHNNNDDESMAVMDDYIADSEINDRRNIVDTSHTNQPIHTGLYLPHVSQWLPQYTLRKKISRTYGPHYQNRITMPPIGLPNKDEFDTMLKARMREKAWKKHGIDTMRRIEESCVSLNVNNVNGGVSNTPNDELLDTMNEMIQDKLESKQEKSNELFDENFSLGDDRHELPKQVGFGNPVFESDKDVYPRLMETWDIDLCYALKGQGDPSLPKAFKDEVFRHYVTAIDRNGSLAPWQKNYAFSLLPKVE